MFQTVRHWWGSGHGKVTARLFLFELFVVIAGVLIAQGLAGYAQRQASLRQMESERARVRNELISAHSVFQTWHAAVPCLDRRLADIMKGASLAPSELRRPQFQTTIYAPPTTEVMDLIAKRYGVEEKNRLDWIAQNSRNASTVALSMIARWGRLMLVDPTNGTVTTADRIEARLAAADIRAQLRAMDVLSTDATRLLGKMGIHARNQNEPQYGPARSCAAIWASGRLDPPLAVR